MLHAWLFTQSGIPVIYSGDEIGQLNDYTYKKDPEKWADSRYLHRGKFPWEKVEKKDPISMRMPGWRRWRPEAVLCSGFCVILEWISI